MANYTALSHVEEARLKALSLRFPPSLAWATNWSSKAAHPRKFTFTACPHRVEDGSRCLKLKEFLPQCPHDEPGVPCLSV